MEEKEQAFVLELYRSNALDVIFCTDSMSMGIDGPCKEVIQIGCPSDISTHKQRFGRAGRVLEVMSRSLVIISVPMVIKAYTLYLSDETALFAYNEAILHFLDTTVCRHVALEMWPSSICDHGTCRTRCDVCEHHFGITVVSMVECASVLVGTGLSNDSGVIGILEKQERSLTLTNIVNEWEAHSHLKSATGDGIDLDLRQFIVLRLCALDFFTPVRINGHVHLRASESRLLRHIYKAHSTKPAVIFKNPE